MTTYGDRGGSKTASMRLWIAVVLFLASLLIVMPAQTYQLWRASVAASEWGHFIALAAVLLLLIPGWGRTVRGTLSAALAVVTLCLSLSPAVRAHLRGRPLAAQLASVFGPATPPGFLDAPARARPFDPVTLFRAPKSPGVSITTLNYVTRSERPLQLDVYRRSGDSAAKPLVITIHGGSWSGGSRSELPELNSYLASRGYVVASVSYRLAPEHPFPAQTEDLNAAIEYLKSHARAISADSSQIVLVGRSAGGQIALQSAYTRRDPAIRGVVSLYGPTDQKWGWDHPSNPRVYDSWAALRSFLHGEPVEVPDAYRESSAINHVDSTAIPTLLIHGVKDPLVSVRQSQRLDSALKAAGRRHLLIELPWATHGCDYVFNGPCGQLSTFAIERFVAAVTSNGRNASAPASSYRKPRA